MRYNVMNGQVFTEEFYGPLNADILVDPETGFVFLQIHPTTCTIVLEGEVIGGIDEPAGLYRLHNVHQSYDYKSGEKLGPPEWEVTEVFDVPAGLIPANARKSRQKFRSIDDLTADSTAPQQRP